MENKPNNVFEKLDTLIVQNEEILDLLKNQKSNQTTSTQSNVSENVLPKESVKNTSDDKQIISTFIKNSKKEHVWFGPISDFNKSKLIVYVLAVSLIIVGVISTILTSIAFKMYSTFSLFENIWLVFAILMFTHSINAKKRIQDIDLMAHSNTIFNMNADGTWYDTNEEKKKYKWFRRISYIAVIANIIVIWVNSNGGLAVAATLFEIAFLGLTIGLYFAYTNLFCMYGNFIFFTGRNLSNTETVTLVFDSMQRKLTIYDELDNNMKKYL